MTLPRREFLMLAKKYNPKRQTVGGWYISEKLDGTRVFWDGGISRGLETRSVPYANTIDPKTGGPKKKIKPVATGLWSRYGNPVIAPDWFLNLLPCMPLDGEIWAGRGNFQLCRSICGGDSPGPAWSKAEFAVFGCPPIDVMFGDGLVKNTNMTMPINYERFRHWLNFYTVDVLEHFLHIRADGGEIPFEQELTALRNNIPSEGRVYLHRQKKLPLGVKDAAKAVEKELNRVVAQGGEGVMLRNPDGPWLPKRVSSLLKYKPFSDDEGTVVGFTSGRKTDKGSKLLGMIGSLILDYRGKRLELAGLTNEERTFLYDEYSAYAAKFPGQDMPNNFKGKHFKVGDTVTFKYRELSDDGIPKEARYWRQR
jgi:DNA ligase-1